MELPIPQGGLMEDLKQQSEYRKAKTMRRRVFRGGLLTVALAGLILIIPTGSDYTVSEKEAAPGITEELLITEIKGSTDEAPMLASLDEEPTSEVALGFSSSGRPEYVTTQPPLIEIPAQILVADNWMPLSPVNTDDLDAQPTIHPQGPRSPTVAGAPGGGSGGPHSPGPQGFGAPSPGGGSPGGGSSGPRNPSSPIASGPSAPPSDPTPGDNGPMVAGPTNTPPVVSAPTPVDLPDDLTGPVVGSNDDPQDNWFSPGNSPGTTEIIGDFTLGSDDTLLFEILGPTAGDQYDQLIVSGDVILDGGDIVIAFINGYIPNTTDLFELILAGDIIVNSVNFYYGFFDDSYPLHAPYDLSYYNVWTAESGVSKTFVDGDSGDRLEVAYVAPTSAPDTTAGPEQPFDPVDIGAEIPTPAPLLLLATGLLLVSSLRRRRA